MGRDVILKAAGDSHLDVYGLGKDRAKFVAALERFTAAIRAATKEEDAMICENTGDCSYDDHIECADAIRASK